MRLLIAVAVLGLYGIAAAAAAGGFRTACGCPLGEPVSQVAGTSGAGSAQAWARKLSWHFMAVFM
jgi:hypothetical protein